MKYTFADIVIVERELLGVIVKCWASTPEPTYEVYVRNWNAIQIFKESEIRRYLVRHKELSAEEMEYQSNAEAA